MCATAGCWEARLPEAVGIGCGAVASLVSVCPQMRFARTKARAAVLEGVVGHSLWPEPGSGLLGLIRAGCGSRSLRKSILCTASVRGAARTPRLSSRPRLPGPARPQQARPQLIATPLSGRPASCDSQLKTFAVQASTRRTHPQTRCTPERRHAPQRKAAGGPCAVRPTP